MASLSSLSGTSDTESLVEQAANMATTTIANNSPNPR